MIADDIYVAQNIGFGIIAAGMIIGALKVVTSKNVVHAALALVLVLSGAAAQYLLLAAEFVAVTQVLVYVGAVMVLFLFGVMLTRAKLGREGDLNNAGFKFAIPVALLMLGVMSWVLIDGFEEFVRNDRQGIRPNSDEQRVTVGASDKPRATEVQDRPSYPASLLDGLHEISDRD